MLTELGTGGGSGYNPLSASTPRGLTQRTMQPEWRDTDWDQYRGPDGTSGSLNLVFPDPRQLGSNAHVLDQEGSMVTCC